MLLFSLYHEPFNVQGTTIANRENIFGNYFYLSISSLTVLYIAFSLAKFLFMIKTKLFAQVIAERCTDGFAFRRLLSNRRSQIIDKPESLVFSGDAKIDLYTSSEKLGSLIATKPFSQKSYSLDLMHAKAKLIIEGCHYCLHVSSELFFRIPYFTSYIDVNCLPLRQIYNYNLCVLWVT